MPNHLAGESSLYLRQHMDNPVDWYPWGQEALDRAKNEDRCIFLSIGYSACHWCHVMAHESFDDEKVADVLNRNFVCIKVDREERPDLDGIYMSAVQALTGRGGWPLSVFLTPEGEPIYGGTYYPPTPRPGMPSFTDVLLRVADAWRNRRPELLDGAERLVAAIESGSEAIGIAGSEGLTPETLEGAFRELTRQFDSERGGWGGAPKFPQPMTLEFLLSYHHSTGDTQARRMVCLTLEAMARGGMYDQLGGGFHRYAVDAYWRVPHFEKMLYDNAQLARVYLHAWQLTGDRFFRIICEETLDYVVREMTDSLGGFYSTQDADSEGEEGRFFVWTPEEIRDILGEDADSFIITYGVTASGNFERKNVLELAGTLDQRLAADDARQRLFDARSARVHPGRDDKVLTSWNGLMLGAFAEAARVLNRGDYRQVAENNAGFLIHSLRRPDGRLSHSWWDGTTRFNGYLADYSHLAAGLLELYQTTFDPDLYLVVQELTEIMLERFATPTGGFYDTSDAHETLIMRPRSLQDSATPSGNAMANLVLLRLAGLALEPRYASIARHNLELMQPSMERHPLGFSQWLVAAGYALAPARQIAILGDPGNPNTVALLEACMGGYRPHQAVALSSPNSPRLSVPLLKDRDLVDGQSTAYVCRDSACAPPVTDPERLHALLD